MHDYPFTLLALQGEMEDSKTEEEPEVTVPKLDVPDLRQMLKRQDEPRATGLFSAAEFIALDDDEAEPQKAADGHEGGILNGMDTEGALTGAVDELLPLTTDVAASGDLNEYPQYSPTLVCRGRRP